MLKEETKETLVFAFVPFSAFGVILKAFLSKPLQFKFPWATGFGATRFPGVASSKAPGPVELEAVASAVDEPGLGRFLADIYVDWSQSESCSARSLARSHVLKTWPGKSQPDIVADAV